MHAKDREGRRPARRRIGRARLLAAAGLLVAALPGAGAAAESSIRIDLNKLEQREGACRAYFVLNNETEFSFEGFVLDLYLFDADGVIAKRVAVNGAPLPAGKTRVTPVDLRDQLCDQVSKILVDNIAKCEDGTGRRDDCIALVEVTSRSAVDLVK